MCRHHFNGSQDGCSLVLAEQPYRTWCADCLIDRIQELEQTVDRLSEPELFTHRNGRSGKEPGAAPRATGGKAS